MQDKGKTIIDFVNKVFLGDSTEIIKDIPDNSVDMLLTDPPWMISNEIVIHRNSNSKYKGKSISYDFGEWDKQWNTKEEYIEWCKRWLEDCVRILKPYRHMIIFYDKAKVSYMWDYLETLDMKMRSPLYFIKTNPVPQARGTGFMASVEMMLWATKHEVKQAFFNSYLGQHTDYFMHSIVGKDTEEDKERVHPCQKPLALNRWLISYLSNENDIILDPFLGSGSTAMACKQKNRRFIGIEAEENYHEKATKRINGTVSGSHMELWNE